jgi:integrase
VLLILLKNKGVITMNKTNKITVCVEGKNIKVEVGTYTLRTLIIKKLNGMAAFKESKHQYKILTISKRKNVREKLALEGKSKEEINDICNRINCFKWKIFAKRTKIDYIEGNIQFCHFLAKKYYTSYLTLKEAEKHIQEFVDDLKERNRSSNTIHDYLASVCKTFGKYMGDYEHPIRHGVCLKVEPMKYNTKLGEKARDLGLLTGLRRNELAQLKIKDIKFIDCETVHIFSIGKGGKHNRTVLKGIVAVEKLKEYIREAEEKGSDFLLTKAEARVPDALHYCRAICAQNTYYAVLKEMENDPAKRAEYVQKIKNEFKRCKRKLKEDLNKPYRLRGYNREAALSIGKPIVYDRVAAMYVSLFILHHFRTDTTILHYLVK